MGKEKYKIVFNEAGVSQILNRSIIKSDDVFLTIAIAIDKDVITKKTLFDERNTGGITVIYIGFMQDDKVKRLHSNDEGVRLYLKNQVTM